MTHRRKAESKAIQLCGMSCITCENGAECRFVTLVCEFLISYNIGAAVLIAERTA
jgi:hypothetical protein